MGRIVLMLIWARTASAQHILDPARLSEDLKRFAPPAAGKVLRCDLSPVRPVLNFGFRFQAGYVVHIPMDQYLGRRHGWLIIERIAPEGDPSRAVYLGERFRLPEIPKTNVSFPVAGGFLLGEGRYRVDWLILDDQDRSAVKHWTINAERRHADRNIRIAQPPGTVAPFSLRGAGAARPADDAAPIRLTILLDAAPLSPRRSQRSPRLRPYDEIMLLGGLSSLLERVPTKFIRLVVFNLDQQRELYRNAAFTSNDLDQVGQVLNQIELGLVDYHILQRPRGYLEFLAGLMNREVHEAEAADVVLMMGPAEHFTDRVPPSELESVPGAPRFLYLQYQPFLHAVSQLPDTIRQAVKTMRGKTLIVHTPADFDRGIAQLEGK